MPGLKSPLESAYLLADPAKKARQAQAGDLGVTLALPAAAPDPVCSVIVLEVKGPLTIEPVLPKQRADGSIRCGANDAICHGDKLKLENADPDGNLGFWLDPADWAEWKFEVTKPGGFTVVAEMAAQASGKFTLTVGEPRAGGTVPLRCAAPATGDYRKFQQVTLGRIEIPSAGKTSLAVKPVPAGWQPMNLKSLVLKPGGPAD